MHSTLHTNEYYQKVEDALKLAKNRSHAIRKLQEIREALLKGTF